MARRARRLSLKPARVRVRQAVNGRHSFRPVLLSRRIRNRVTDPRNVQTSPRARCIQPRCPSKGCDIVCGCLALDHLTDKRIVERLVRKSAGGLLRITSWPAGRCPCRESGGARQANSTKPATHESRACAALKHNQPRWAKHLLRSQSLSCSHTGTRASP